jgi:hypothetical protein
MSEEGFFRMNSRGIVPESNAPVSVPKSDICERVRVDPDLFGADALSLLRETSTEIRNIVRILIGSSNVNDEMSVFLFVLLTYQHRGFSLIPNLWVASPDQDTQVVCDSVLRLLCFNAVPVSGGLPPEAIARLTNEYTATLLVNRPQGDSFKKWSFHPWDANRSDSFHLDREMNRVALFSPRIVLTSEILPIPNQNFTLPITARAISYEEPSVSYGPDLRFKLCLAAAKMASMRDRNEIAVNRVIPRKDVRFAFFVIAECLQEHGVLSRDECEAYKRDWEKTREALRRRDPMNRTLLILRGLMKYRREFDPTSVSREHSIEKMAMYIAEDDVLADVNSRSLSRVLSLHKLIRGKPRRPRILNPNNGGNTGPPTYRQLIHVELDFDRIVRLIKSHPES